jgi:hypothetical protein
MVRLAALACVVVGFGLPYGPLRGEESLSPAELVRQLGSSRYPVRQQAMARLLTLGAAAKEALLDGRRDADPEIVARCRELLPAVLDADLRRRIDLYRANRTAGLPFETSFARKVGNTDAMRAFYANLAKRRGLDWESWLADPAGARGAIRAHTTALYQQLFASDALIRTPMPVRQVEPVPEAMPDVAGLLWYLSETNAQLTPDDWPTHLLYSHPGYGLACRDRVDGLVYRRILGGFLQGRVDDYAIANVAHLLCVNLIAEGADPVAMALKTGRFKQPWTTCAALATLAHIGSKSHRDALAGSLDDRREVQQVNVDGRTGTLEVRDVALAVWLHLDGRDPKALGFPEWSLPERGMLNSYTLGFADTPSRDAAFRHRR